jgi:hypothetical protein
VSRVWRFVLVSMFAAAWALSASQARADGNVFPLPPMPPYWTNCSGGGGCINGTGPEGQFGTITAACSAVTSSSTYSCPNFTTGPHVINQGGTSPNGTGQCQWACNGFTITNDLTEHAGGTSGSCPANSTAVSGGCSCNTGWTNDAGNTGCQRNCPTAGSMTNAGVQLTGTGSLPSGNMCFNGCSYQTGTGVGVVGVGWASWLSSSVGTSCLAGVGTTGSATTAPPPPGYCTGTVNGATVQLPCSGQPGTTVVQNTSSTTGTTSTTAGGTTTPGVSTTQGTTTTVQGGSSSTTITTTTINPDGSRTASTTTSDRPLNSFCTDNPAASICRIGNFGGSCSGGFTCDGDAAECAVAKEVYRRNCALFDVATTMSDLGNAAAAGTDTGTSGNPALAANRETRAIAAFDQTSFLSAGAIADMTVNIPIPGGSGVSFVWEWSRLNTPLVWIGNVALALSLLFAALWVLRD